MPGDDCRSGRACSARTFGLDSRRECVAIRARFGNLPGDFGYGKGATGREALSLLARLRGMESRAEALAKRFRADQWARSPDTGGVPGLVGEERERGCAVYWTRR